MEPNAPGPAQATPMRDVIDYAGLFPPAALPMGAALDEYAAASTGPDAHMLGRFVITAAHLPAFAETVVTRPDLPARLPLSVIVRPGSDDDHGRS